MKAPALEKGLDVMEILVAQSDALTLSQIATRTGRTVSEIQRMVHVLHQRGYIDKTEANAYRPGLKLYELGRFRHPFQHLQTIAEPYMAKAAVETGHSVHLSVEDRGQMMILSEILGSGVGAVALKVGSRHSLEETLSGRILLMNEPDKAKSEDLKKIKASGYLHLESSLYAGVQDIGVPIIRKSDERIVGVLACNWLIPKNGEISVGEVAEVLRKAADDISSSL